MEAVQEVVLIQDSATEVCVSFIKWALKGLPLRARDKFTLVSVLHQVNTALGPKRVDANSLLGTNPRIIESEASRIQREYENHAGLVQISQVYTKRKVEFKIEVATGPSCRLVGVKAAESLNATLVILHRQMKNDKKYFLKNLSCGIWRIKDNCKIEQLRAPEARNAREAREAREDREASISGDLSPVELSPRSDNNPMHDEISLSISAAVDDDLSTVEDELFSIEI